ncbi:MAG: hypothetical protein QM750_20385 [Rubrivivax sp.]
MKLTPRQRWMAYAAAGALTAAAMWAVDHRAEPAAAVQAVPRTAAAPGGGRQPRSSPPPLPLMLTLEKRVSTTPRSDPFAPLGAEATATAAAAASAAAARAAAGPPPAPAAPPLPFSYLGRWQEQGRSAVFLWRGDRSVKVLGPGPLDADYAVERLEPRRLLLRYLPLNQLQELSFDAPPPAPAPQTPAPAAGPPADGTPVEDN